MLCRVGDVFQYNLFSSSISDSNWTFDLCLIINRSPITVYYIPFANSYGTNNNNELASLDKISSRMGSIMNLGRPLYIQK